MKPYRLDLADRGVQFIFPKRNLGMFRLIGVLLMVVPIFFMFIPIYMVADIAQGDDSWWFAIFPLFLLIPLMIPMLFGLLILGGHSEVELRRSHLRYTERFGPLRKRWTRKLDDVTGLRIAGVLEVQSQNPNIQSPKSLIHLAVIVASTSHTEKLGMPMAVGYPREILLPVAEDLARQAAYFCGSPWPVETQARTDGDLMQDDRLTDDATVVTAASGLTLDDIPDLPAKSTATLERDGDNLTIHIPPAGIWRGSKGLFGFSLAWCAFMVVFTTIAGSTVFTEGLTMVALLFGGFILMFWSIGIGMLVFALNMGKRQAIIDVIGDTLLVSRQSLFGTKQDEWQAGDIKRIIVGPSGGTINNKPIMNLQVITKDDKTTGMFSERADDELKWIARILQIGLRL